MNKWLTIKDGKVVIEPEVINISFFKVLWDRDKSKDKIKFYDDINYIFYVVSPASPLLEKLPQEKIDFTKQYILSNKSYTPDEEVKFAMEKYKESPDVYPEEVKLLDAMISVVGNLYEYMKTVDINNLKDPTKLIQIFEKAPTLIKTLNQAKEDSAKSITGISKIRGNAKTSMLENNEL